MKFPLLLPSPISLLCLSFLRLSPWKQLNEVPPRTTTSRSSNSGMTRDSTLHPPTGIILSAAATGKLCEIPSLPFHRPGGVLRVEHAFKCRRISTKNSQVTFYWAASLLFSRWLFLAILLLFYPQLIDSTPHFIVSLANTILLLLPPCLVVVLLRWKINLFLFFISLLVYYNPRRWGDGDYTDSIACYWVIAYLTENLQPLFRVY